MLVSRARLRMRARTSRTESGYCILGLAAVGKVTVGGGLPHTRSSSTWLLETSRDGWRKTVELTSLLVFR